MTQQALKQSIEHWKDNLARAERGDKIDVSPKSCALCELYIWEHDCLGCPIYKATGFRGCDHTPYFYTAKDPTPENVRAELQFLQALVEAE